MEVSENEIIPSLKSGLNLVRPFDESRCVREEILPLFTVYESHAGVRMYLSKGQAVSPADFF